MWNIDTFNNQQTGYFFEMNPSGLMGDALRGANFNNRVSNAGLLVGLDDMAGRAGST